MKTPALLMLSALVALGHWLLLAPGPDTLVQLTPMVQATRPEVSPTPRVMQTRRISSALPITLSAPAIAPVIGKPKSSPSQTSLNRTRETLPAAMPASAVAIASPEPSARDDIPLPNPSHEQEGSAAAAAEPANVVPPQAALTPPLAAPFLTSLQLPKAVRLNYDIMGQSRGLSYRASGVLDWQHDDKRYDARMVASVFLLGSRSLSSQGEVTADGLAPTRFADKSRSEQAAHFQPDKGKITFSANTPDAPWQRGAQDRLSVFFQLAGMLAGQPERLPPGTHIPVYTAGARSADIWTFVVDGSDQLKLPAGDIAAIKLTRQSRADYDQTVELWFAPALSYWPVRIKVTQRNGDFVDQQLASVPTP